MALVNPLRRPLVVRQIAVWGVEVARRCHPLLAVQLGQKMYRLSLSEARGYIRARSAAVLDEQVAVLQQQTGCDPEMAAAIRRRAMHELIRLTIGDLLKATRRPTPALRRAA